MSSLGQLKKVIHGDIDNDDYLLIREDDELLIVHTDYFRYENAIIFTVGHLNTDWSEGMLFQKAIEVVDSMNNRSNS